ncbi:hypothetical protein BV378_06100 [Nostoc sp. RF31YmG]|nr:hypothetical protein BV378_06100 [Nostoc sp. RF31YmG]
MTEYVNVNTSGEKNKIVDGFSFLGLGNFTSLITNIKFADWGETVFIDCVYHPTERLPYRILFSKCDEIKWFMNDSDLINEIEADIIDFQIKKDGERESAYFHTDIFELLISYQSIKIDKLW